MTPEELAARRAARQPILAAAAEAAFGDDAASMVVPIEVVLAAAAHTYNMLDDEQKVELVEEAMDRWKAAQATATAVGAIQSGDTTVVVSNERNQMRDDLLYKLLHRKYDLLYTFALRLPDADGGGEHQEWLITPPRQEESETPVERVVVLLTKIVETMRKSRQRFEKLRLDALAKARRTP